MNIIMNIIEWFIWGIGVLILIAYVPLYFHRDPLIGRLFKGFAFLIAIGLVVTLFTQHLKLHLLWWIPVSFVLKDFIFRANFKHKYNRFVKKMDREREKHSIPDS